MKAVRLNVLFKLPDDFSGGLNEAIEEIIKYRKNRKLTIPTDDSESLTSKEVSTLDKANNVIWNRFLTKCMDDKYKLTGEVNLVERQDGAEWTRMEGVK